MFWWFKNFNKQIGALYQALVSNYFVLLDQSINKKYFGGCCDKICLDDFYNLNYVVASVDKTGLT